MKKRPTKTKPEKIKRKQVATTGTEPLYRRQFFAYFLIIFFTFLAYGNTLSYDYALDDFVVISKNEFTKNGVSGIEDIFTHDTFAGHYGEKNLLSGGRYRPLSVAMFALEWQAFGDNPKANHFMNVLLLALSSILLFLFLKKLLIHFLDVDKSTIVSLFASLLFIVHPIHTEAVANIKGRDEMMAFAGVIASLYFMMKYAADEKRKHLIAAFLFALVGLFSKENAITLIALTPLCFYFIGVKEKRKYLVSTGVILLASIMFIAARQAVLGIPVSVENSLMDDPFLYASDEQQVGTIIYTLALYIKLLFIPHPLTWDYYPYHIQLLGFKDFQAIISFFLLVALTIAGIWTAYRRSLFGFCILWFFITLSPVTNILFPVGVFMAERFLYLPSLGFCLALAYFIISYLPVRFSVLKNIKTGSGIILSILALFTLMTMNRNKVWKDDYTLYTTDVLTSSSSAKSNDIAAQFLLYEASKSNIPQLRKEYSEISIAYLHKAVSIYPEFQNAMFHLANAIYDYRKDIDSTIYYYKKILTINPAEENVLRNISLILPSVADKDKALNIYLDLHKINPGLFDFNFAIGNLYVQKGQYPQAKEFLENAVKAKPTSADALKNLGITLYYLKQYSEAIVIFEKALLITPGDEQLKQYLGAARIAKGG